MLLEKAQQAEKKKAFHSPMSLIGAAIGVGFVQKHLLSETVAGGWWRKSLGY
jgi:hypothetical protein